MNYEFNPDTGRETGSSEAFEAYLDNYGPLVRENRMTNNDINGMLVRGGTLTTESIWDDTDIVHVLQEEIVVPNHHTYSGLRLQSSADESLVVKLSGPDAGFTAMGVSGEGDDRIGGTLQILGTPEHPVVLTALEDDSFGAGFDPWGNPQMNTDNANDIPTAGKWRSIRLDTYCNDRNVAIASENESVFDPESGTTNDAPNNAQYLGQLAEGEKDGDDVLRLGFEVHGAIRADNTDDMDVYSFDGTAGTEVWIDIDRTSQALDTVVELIDADGQVVFASSNDSYYEQSGVQDVYVNAGLAQPMFADSMDRDVWLSKDTYSINMMDAGMRLVLPGTVGETRTYYVRVRSASGVSGEGLTSGAYELQVRLRETQEFAGSTVQYASIHYATNGIEMFGLPTSSPLLADLSEYQQFVNGQWQQVTDNDTRANAVQLGNLLETSAAAIKVAGDIDSVSDVDWYQFEIQIPGVQSIPGVNADTPAMWPVCFDIDYADGTGRPDTQIWVFDSDGRLIYRGDDSSIGDDLITRMQTDPDVLSGGSFGAKDAFVGPVFLSQSGTYYVAVTGSGMVADALKQDLIRREPVNSVNRDAEDHIETGLGNTELEQPSEARASKLGPALAPNEDATELVTGTTTVELSLAVDQFHLGDAILYVSTGSDLYTIDPFTGQEETDVTGPMTDVPVSFAGFTDIEMRDDGRIFGFEPGVDDATSSLYRQVSTADGTIIYDYGNTAGAQGIATFRLVVEGSDEEMELSPEAADVGVQFTAMTYIPHDMLGSIPIDSDSEGQLEPGAFFAIGQFGEGEYQTNLLYIFNADGKPVNPPNSEVPDGEDYVGTNPLPLGMLTSSPSIGMVGTENQIPDLYDDLLDGLTFEIDAEDEMANTETYVFEFDFGYEVRYLEDAPAINDGDTFVVNGTTFEFDDGRTHILTVESFNGPQDGETFTIQNENGAVANFEIDNDGTLNNDDYTGVYLQGVTSNEAAAQAIAIAINGATVAGGSALGVSATTDGDQVLLSGNLDGNGVDGTLVNLGNLSGGISYANTGGVAFGNEMISFTPNDSEIVILQAVADAINAAYPLSTFAGGNRITLSSPVTNIDFSGTEALTETAGAAPGVGAGNIAIPLHAGMTAIEVTEATANAINDEGLLITATANGGTVGISGISDSNWMRVPEPLSAFGGGQGGRITGLTFVENVLYAVDDAGGFYTIDNLSEPGFQIMEEDATPNDEEDEETYFIMRPTDDNEDGIPDAGPMLTPIAAFTDASFSGLDHGPETLGRGLNEEGELEEKGPYAEMMFATDSAGRLYAFDTDGVLQPIFMDGFSTIPTGVGGITGVAFSNIDYNLWHPTAAYETTQGHGITVAHDMSRQDNVPGPSTPDQDGYFPADGNVSYYFGLEDPDSQGSIANQPGASSYHDFESALNDKIYTYANNYTNQEVLNTYDTPGGAHGSLTTNTFSLATYSPSDEPKVYFNYFLDTQGGDIWDGAKVYISADGATWDLLTSNTDLYGSGNLQWAGDPTVLDQEDAARPELIDDVGGGWRQACVNLGNYAGLDNLRLRFDFSTASDMNVGGTPGSREFFSTGAYLTAIPGNELVDGDSLSIDGQVFEFDMGFSLLLPNVAGAAITYGQTITLSGETSSATLEFVENAQDASAGNIPVLIHAGMSTSEVADAILTAIEEAFPSDPEADPPIVGEVIAHVKDNRVYLQGALNATTDSMVVLVEGDAPGTLSDDTAIAVPIHAGMTADEVAYELATVIDATFSNEDLEDFFTSVKVDGEFLHMIGHAIDQPDPFTGEPALALPYSDTLMGDGEHNADDLPQDRFENNGRGQDNRYEGFYIDDIIIGCTERGEMITNAQPEDTFSPQSTGQNITTGSYELEIRTGTQYGMLYMGNLVFFNAYDTNDRMSDNLTLLAPQAKDIPEGHTFTVSDGVDVVTFQFLDATLGNEPEEGNVAVMFTGEETIGELTLLIAETINSVEHLDVTATMNYMDSSNRIDLFGATKTTGMDVIYFGGTANASLANAIPSDVLTATPSTDANKLRDALLGSGIAPVGDATLVSGDASAGFWTDGSKSGILLTTGDIANAVGPNLDGASVGDASGMGDADLDAEFGAATNDATSLEFDFEWQGGDLFLQFFFGSEEFNEFFSEDLEIILQDNGLSLEDLRSTSSPSSSTASTSPFCRTRTSRSDRAPSTPIRTPSSTSTTIRKWMVLTSN